MSDSSNDSLSFVFPYFPTAPYCHFLSSELSLCDVYAQRLTGAANVIMPEVHASTAVDLGH
jgi:hypothetical protein